MKGVRLPLGWALGLLLPAFAGAAAADELPPPVDRTVDYVADIRPLFEKSCYPCHGPGNQINGLRLDQREAALAGGLSGPAILPGDSAGSRLIHMVAGYQVKSAMPPSGPLSGEQIGMLRAWIDQGAIWPEEASSAAPADEQPAGDHWAWSPRTHPAPPEVANAAFVRNPIDRFVAARLEDEDLAPSPEADRRTLIRRVSLDLTGLPPTLEQTEAFVNDDRPGAYERLVDELLRSPAYGEKWAMHWLDQVRYADSDGYEKDDARPHAWRYRHWVIDALNHDMPFDQFSIEQIAGDLLPHPTTEQLVATGFHRNTLRNREGGVNFEQFRFEENVDRVNTISQVWLGLTVGCAQCHDHKYDPITQKDYYRFYAFFERMEEDLIRAPLQGELGPWLKTHEEYRRRRDELLCEYGVPEMLPEWEKKIRYHGEHPGEDTKWDVHWDTLAKMTDGGDRFILIPRADRTEREMDVVVDYFLRFYNQIVTGDEYKALGFPELRGKLLRLEQRYPQTAHARVVFERDEPLDARVRVRGQWDRKGVEVKPAAPAFLPQIETAGETPSRLDLARWIFDPGNPLTARVTVNRIWQRYFGQGLSSTTDDFGKQGEAPSHPELLDWLAQDFIDSGWSLKALHRRIVTSATYRQSSNARPELDSIDPDNRLLARQNRVRLSAELIRDSALAASGLLSHDEIGGKSVHPPIPDGVTNLSYAGGFEWDVENGPEQYRRGLYIHFQRTVPYPFLMTFDSSERTVAVCTRERSNTPLQALNLLNDPVFFEAAQGLATRLLSETPSYAFGDRLTRAYELALARPPSKTEAERIEQYYQAQLRLLDSEPKAVREWYPVDLPGHERIEAAAWTGVSRLLLNLDEFITRE